MNPDKKWIAAHIPHQHAMCLLDHVRCWDTQQLIALADSHTAPDHPLRAGDRLGAANGIEYAAQAMAVHSALIATSRGETKTAVRPRAGYLASVRNTTLHVTRLDDIAEALEIEVNCVHDDGNCVLYQFFIRGDQSQRLLLDGRATVIIDAEKINPQPRSAEQE